ncbi:MAG: class SAM-dependent methyltransferase [Mucilaginibacter sp.]|nr:class SAM-dependent methyltransferase [Mucilaginibacter sp.]
MASNYDNSAWFYDRLSRVIYGKALIRSQVYLLQYIPAGATILIAGGGTGWILEEIVKIHPSGLKITYAEISANMMALSLKRNAGNNEVIYINEAVENVAVQNQFDVVITPFLFDNFTEQTLQKVFAHIHQRLKPGGIWLNTDFCLTGKWWQKLLLRSMILFFRIICRIEATRLPDIEKCFEQQEYKVISQKSFFGEFILSTAYRKQTGVV